LDKFSDRINEAKTYSSYEEFLLSKKCVLEEGYWNCPGHLMIPERIQNLFIKNGNLVCKFGIIKGKFTFRAEMAQHKNTNPDKLTSLKGMPLEVGDRFTVDWQKGITSAIGCPRKVGGDVVFKGCRLTSLEGLPATCQDLLLQSNQFTDLTGLSCSPRGNIDMSYGKLTSLEGLTQEISCKHFDFRENKVSSLKGITNIKAEHFGTMNNKLPEFLTDYIARYKGNNFFLDLLTYMMNNNLHAEVDTIYWPDGFLNDNLKKSVKGIGKFNI